MKSLSEELVEIVAPLLIQGGFFLATDFDTYKAKLAAGTLKAEDWLMAVENAMTKEAK